MSSTVMPGRQIAWRTSRERLRSRPGAPFTIVRRFPCVVDLVVEGRPRHAAELLGDVAVPDLRRLVDVAVDVDDEGHQ